MVMSFHLKSKSVHQRKIRNSTLMSLMKNSQKNQRKNQPLMMRRIMLPMIQIPREKQLRKRKQNKTNQQLLNLKEKIKKEMMLFQRENFHQSLNHQLEVLLLRVSQLRMFLQPESVTTTLSIKMMRYQRLGIVFSSMINLRIQNLIKSTKVSQCR